MGAVFLNYRRGDSEGQARALFVELTRLLGKDSVFMDVDSIALGRDFRAVLQERLGSCDVMVTLIGPDWLDAADPSGKHRLESPTDFVRQEIAAALKRNIPVIPVLVQGARMPESERLPEDLKDLPYRNGFELGHTTWESDVAEMVKRLGLPEQKPSASVPPPSRVELPAQGSGILRARRVPAAIIAAAIGAVALLVYFYPGRTPTGTSEPPVRSAAPKGGTFVFNWPGNDCWDIFRGEQLVRYHCGADKQSLEAGAYTIKGRHAPVFAPFQITIESGASTQIQKGGLFIFNWSGRDCWNIFRGEQLVTYHCGTDRQALEGGTYIIKARHAPVFEPFQIKVADGSQVKAP